MGTMSSKHQKRSRNERVFRFAFAPRKQQSNLRDPFQALGHDVVSLIIALLPARDTETLRRVSKLWKHSSEYHCGKSALLKHFPWALAKADRFETREEANLQFRRCLHYWENLEAGFATRAIRCDGASDWHVHDDRLLWCRKKEPPLIMDLRTVDGRSITGSDSMKIDIRYAFSFPIRAYRRYFQIISEFELLITTLSSKDTVNLARMNGGETDLWSVDLKTPMTRPVIGKESIYFVHGPGLDDDVRECKMSFAKHRLCDGSTIFDVSMPPETRIRGEMFYFGGSLMLTGNERLALWGRISCTEVYILSTSTGQVLQKIGQRRCREFSPRPHPNTHTAEFWITSQRRTVLCLHDETSDTFSEVQDYQLDGDDSDGPPSVTSGGDRSVSLRILRPREGHGARISGSTNHVGQLAVSPTVHASDSESVSLGWAVPITRPGRSKAYGTGRELELELLKPYKEGDFFGMVDGYLVYHSREEESLFLVDFWPVW